MRASPDRVQNYQTFWISPLDVHFAHDSVAEYFRPFADRKGRRHENKSILDTVWETATTEIPEELECIDVVWLGDGLHGRWTVAGTFNRRLVVFRLLAIFLPERFRLMKVCRRPEREVRWQLSNGRSKLSTECSGIYVEVRWQRFVGRGLSPAGDDRKGVVWPEAEQLFLNLA